MIKARKDFSYFAHLFFAVSVLVLVVLAGCRDYTIGTDVLVYGNNVFNLSRQSTSLIELIKKYGTFVSDERDTWEILFLAINYFVGRFTDSAHWVYAVIACIIYSNFFIGIYKYRDNLSITLAWLFFILLLFARSLNLMRQMLAMSVMFLGSYHILKRESIKYIPYAIIAFLFHQSSLPFSITFVVIGFLLLGKNNTTKYKISIILGAFVFFFAYDTVLQFFMHLGIFTDHMSVYVFSSEGTFSLNPFIQRVIPLIILTYYTKGKILSDGVRDYFIVMIILELILVQMRTYGLGLERVSMYFSIFNIYSYAALSERIVKPTNRIIVKCFLVAFLSAIWYYQIILMGGSEVYPYTSELLGIG